MALYSQHGALQNLENETFKLVSHGATPELWIIEWLKEQLKHALAGGSVDVVDALRAAGGLNGSKEYRSHNHPYPQRASLQGFECEFFRLLESSGHGPGEEWANWQRVPLEHAAARGNLELVNALLVAGANGGAGWRGCRSHILLDAAALGGKTDVVSALVGAGAGPDVNVVSVCSKRSALYTAFGSSGGGRELPAPRGSVECIALGSGRGVGTSREGLAVGWGRHRSSRSRLGQHFYPHCSILWGTAGCCVPC